MKHDNAIEINHLSKIYYGAAYPAISDVSLNIKTGSIFGLLGPNGAGKTTLISMLCGLLQPSGGNAIILGLTTEKYLEKIKYLIGIAPQEIALYSTLTAYENLRFIGKMYGINGDRLKKRINECLEIVGLQSFAGKLVQTFSGGMKRRLNLIAGLLNDPKILFLDEPTEGVDVQSRNVIIEHLKLLNKQGCTIVYTSHLMEEAQNFCTDIVLIDNGVIIANGKPNEMIAKNATENLEQLYLKLTGKKLRD